MDGFGLVIVCFFSAMISSFVYLLIWLFYPSKTVQPPSEEMAVEPWA